MPELGYSLSCEEHLPNDRFANAAEDAGFGFTSISDYFHPWNATWSSAKRARVGTIVDQDPVSGAAVDSGTMITLWFRGRSIDEGPYGSVLAPSPNFGPTYVIKNVSPG